jgi:hypothetical protein
LLGIKPVDGAQWSRQAVEKAAEEAEKRARGLGDVVREMLAARPQERPHIVEVLRRLVEIYQNI